MLRRVSLSIPSKLQLNKPRTRTEEELQKIRTKELDLINSATKTIQQNTNAQPSYVYIISNTWLDNWKCFINKAGARPGPIRNNDLLDNNKQPKQGLEKVVHYRGLDEREWKIFHQVYGGGPVIIRKTVDIYDEPVILPTLQSRMKRRLSEVSHEAKLHVLNFKEDTTARMTMTGAIKSGVESLRAIINPEICFHHKERSIPFHLIKNAKGFAFMTEIKAGFLFSAKMCIGIVIARSELNDSGWTGPSCFAHGGIGAGLMAGASQTKTVIVLNKDMAVDVFKGKGQFKFGGDLEVAVGPVGRNASGDIRYSDGFAPCYSYSHSKGLYAGISIDGTLVVTRNDENARFYGMPVTPGEILTGTVNPPKDNGPLSELYEILKALDKRVSSESESDLI